MSFKSLLIALIILCHHTRIAECISWNEMPRSFRLNFRKDGLSKEIRKGVTVDQIQKHSLTEKNIMGIKMTPFIEAIKAGNSDMVIYLLDKRPSARVNMIKGTNGDNRAILDILFEDQGANPEFVEKVLPHIKRALFNDYHLDSDRKRIDNIIAQRYKIMMNEKRIRDAFMLINSWPNQKYSIHMDALAMNTADQYKNDFKYYETKIQPMLRQLLLHKEAPLGMQNKAKDIYNSYLKFDENAEKFLESLQIHSSINSKDNSEVALRNLNSFNGHATPPSTPLRDDVIPEIQSQHTQVDATISNNKGLDNNQKQKIGSGNSESKESYKKGIRYFFNKNPSQRKKLSLVDAIKTGNEKDVLSLLRNQFTPGYDIMKGTNGDNRVILDVLFQEKGYNPEFVQNVLPGIKKALFNEFVMIADRKQIDKSIMEQYKIMMNRKRIKDATMMIHSWPVAKYSVYADVLSTRIADTNKNDLTYYKREVAPKLLEFMRDDHQQGIPAELKEKAKSIYISYLSFDGDVGKYMDSILAMPSRTYNSETALRNPGKGRLDEKNQKPNGFLKLFGLGNNQPTKGADPTLDPAYIRGHVHDPELDPAPQNVEIAVKPDTQGSPGHLAFRKVWGNNQRQIFSPQNQDKYKQEEELASSIEKQIGATNLL